MIMYFAACSQIDSKHGSAKSNYDTLKITTGIGSPKIDEYILSSILEYYKNKYGGIATAKETTTDSTIKIRYDHVRVPNTEFDNWEGFLESILIARYNAKTITGVTPFLFGDLNNDGLKDLVVNVYTDAGGSGSDGWCYDLFVFLNKKDKLMLTSITHSNEISGCEIGHFYAAKIRNGFLIGNSSCFAPIDATCCPSLDYATKVKFLNGKLMFQSKEKIKGGIKS